VQDRRTVVDSGETRYNPIVRKLLAVALVSVAALSAVVALIVAGAFREGASSPTPEPLSVTPPVRAAVRPHVLRVPLCSAGSLVRLDRPGTARAATALTRVTAYRTPGGAAFARFGRLNVNGVPTVFSVLAARLDSHCRASWYRVQLPLRPNGITGWVRAGAVAQRALDVRIVVDLSERRVTVYRGARPVVVTKAAIGAPSTPTPTGRYYVNQKLVAPDPLGPYGPAALGISAFSPVLQHWAQGGPIAIHGTNEPSLLGSAVSHGCVRVPNDVVERLWKLVPTGTPVLIRM
jgi:lipoprotein-anchoring transpeptidase ErfK/SrfK